jgi:hypothetical protein
MIVVRHRAARGLLQRDVDAPTPGFVDANRRTDLQLQPGAYARLSLIE